MTRKDWRLLAVGVLAFLPMGALLAIGSAAGWINDRCDRLFWRLARWAEVDQ